MGKALYIRTLTAGRYRKVVRYTRPLPGDAQAVRQAKKAAARGAQKYINAKNCADRLELLLCANFDQKGACFCTFTFRDDCLPANQKHTEKIFSSFIRKLRTEQARHSRDMKYIYATEGTGLQDFPEAVAVDGMTEEITPWKKKEYWEALTEKPQEGAQEKEIRLHVHCFLLLEKRDYETVRAFWPYGHVYINCIQTEDKDTFHRLAYYVTKESRSNQKRNGARSYTPSKNLKRPEITGHWCEEYEAITLPRGAVEIRHEAYSEEVWGSSMECLVYRVPWQQQTPPPYQTHGRIEKL